MGARNRDLEGVGSSNDQCRAETADYVSTRLNDLADTGAHNASTEVRNCERSPTSGRSVRFVVL